MITQNPIGLAVSLLILIIFYGLYRIFRGIGFRYVSDTNGIKWEMWIDNRNEGKKKEPEDTTEN